MQATASAGDAQRTFTETARRARIVTASQPIRISTWTATFASLLTLFDRAAQRGT